MKTKRLTSIVLSMLIALSLMPGYAFAEGESFDVNDQNLTETTDAAKAPEKTDVVQEDNANTAEDGTSDVTKGNTSGPRGGAEIIDSGTCGDNLTWTLDSDGVLTISGNGAMEDYESASASPWYSNRASIVTVVIEDGVTCIGARSFYNCNNLKNVEIGDSVESIEKWALYNDSSLEELLIPSSVSTLSGSSIRQCASLSRIKFTGNAPSVGSNVFTGCAGNIVIYYHPGSSGWDSTPWTSYSLESAHFIKNESVITEPTCTESGMVQGTCGVCGKIMTEEMPLLGHNYVDGSCTRCGDVQIIIANGDGWTLYGTGLLEWNDKLPNGNVPWETYKDRITEVVIGANVESIVNNAFQSCESLTSITIPDGVTSIGNNAFRGCSSLISITIPDSVRSIGVDAFPGCSSLTSITIPESVTSMGSCDFSSCSSLTSITIPDCVTSIGGYDFSGCSSLTSITIPDSVRSIGEAAFQNCSSLTSITIPDSVTYIANAAFFRCSSLTSITIPDSVMSIGGSAFSACSSLTSITIPDGVTDMYTSLFSGCSSLTSITIPDSVTRIEESAFWGCNKLRDVYYTGTKKDWSDIWISIGNDTLKAATIHYNYCAYHDLISYAAVPASCKEPGNIAYWECSICHKYFSDAKGRKQIAKNSWIVPATGEHTVEEWTVAQPSTCAATGMKKGECAICHNTITETIPVDPEAHAWGEWAVTKAATCTTEGEETKTCQHDAAHIEKRSIDIDPEAHDWSESEWTWSDDHSSAIAKFTCKNDNSHTETMNAEVTVFIDDSGGTFYTAKALLKGKEYTNTFTTEKSTRIYGSSRYDTAIKAADEYKAATGSQFENVVVAYGKNFPDALSGGYLAKVKHAPILLVEPSVEDMMIDYINENIASGGTVYILGGSGVVSTSFENKVKDRGINTERLGGATRYETNLKILEAARVTNQDILVCTGTGYADSLSASAVGKPILLVGNTLTDDQKKYVKGLSTKQFYLIGGIGAVNPAIEKGLNDLGYNVERLAGATRYETSTEVATKFFPEAKTVVLAYAKNFPDGLSGGPLAMKKNAPIILTDSNKTEAAAKYVKETGAVISITLGGSSLISDIAATAIMGI